MSFATDYTASKDPTFIGMVEIAMISAAISIASEQTVLSNGIPVGAVASLPATVYTAIPQGTAIQVGADVFVTSAAVASGATAIPVTAVTTTNAHLPGETLIPPSPVLAAERLNYARRVMNNPSAYAVVFAAACASQGLSVASTDAQISNAISSVWNALIGA